MGEARVLSDLALARRLELAEGLANARHVEARARLEPSCGAEWTEIAGTYALFDGASSLCTQSFGLGTAGVPSWTDMEALEGFFETRGAPAQHEVSAIAGKALLTMFAERHYRPVEVSDVLVLPLGGRDAVAADAPAGIRVRVASGEDLGVWADVAADGWSDIHDRETVRDLCRITCGRTDLVCFLAEVGGVPAGAAGLFLQDGVALMAGASTIPEYRGRGAQRALFEARIAYAVRAGCELATISVEPGSTSERNAQRRGFTIAYGRTKWALAR